MAASTTSLESSRASIGSASGKTGKSVRFAAMSNKSDGKNGSILFTSPLSTKVGGVVWYVEVCLDDCGSVIATLFDTRVHILCFE